MADAEPRRILVVVGDDRLAIEGLSHRLGRDTSAYRVAAATPGDATIDDADVCVWDLGAHPLEELALPTTELPVVALVPDGSVARRAFAAGARGVLLRDTSARRIRAGIDAVLGGLIVLDDELAEDTMRPAAPPSATMEPLTPRELAVLEQLALGLSNKDIAARLGVSPHTAKFHVNSLMAKLGAASRTEAVAIAARAGLVTF